MRISDWSSDVCSSDLVLVDAAGDRLGAWMHVWRVLVPRTSAGPAVGGVDARLAGIGAPNVGRSRGWGRGCTFGGQWCPQRRPVPPVGAWVDWKSVHLGKRVSVSVDIGGRRILNKKKITY